VASGTIPSGTASNALATPLVTINGAGTYLDVLDSQRSWFLAELTLAQARNNEYRSLVQLYKALGGGWK
jgi:outer membrane protein TolC